MVTRTIEIEDNLDEIIESVQDDVQALAEEYITENNENRIYQIWILPAEFFDSGYPDFDPAGPKVPYAVYRVDTDQEVKPEKELSPVIEVD